MFYVLEPDLTNAPHTSLVREPGIHETIWVRGHIVDKTELKLPLEVLCEKHCTQYSDFMNVGLAPVCSPRFRDALLSSVVDNMQFFPVVIRDTSGNVRDEYLLFNVIGRVSALDMDASKYTEYRGKVFRMKSMALQKDLPDLDMFRLHEYQQIVIVSERIRDHLEAAGLTGIRLTPANGWSDAHRYGSRG